jgi:hypothetical protein
MAIEGEKSMSLNVNPLRFAKPYVAGGCIVIGLFCTMAHAADLHQDSIAAAPSSLPAMKPSLLAAAGDFGLKLDFGVASQPDECDETVTAESPLITAMVAPESAARPEQPSAATAKPTIVAAARADQVKSSAPRPTVAAAAPQPQAAPVPQSPARNDSAAAMQWEIALTDKTLNAALARWAAVAGWQLLWELPVDYAVDAHTTISGSFADAVTAVTRSMETAEIPMKAIFYQGNKVLRIVAKGVE